MIYTHQYYSPYQIKDCVMGEARSKCEGKNT
jgi:hypothetical protein